MKAEEILRTAANLVSGPRAEQHGDVDKVFREAAATMRIPGFGPSQAVMFMVALKIARMNNGTFNIDDYIDACGYIALAGQMNSGITEYVWNLGVPQ